MFYLGARCGQFYTYSGPAVHSDEMPIDMILPIIPSSLLLMTASGIHCLTSIPLLTRALRPPREVVVKGIIRPFAPKDSIGLKGFSLTFSIRREDGKTQRISDPAMPTNGYYRVRLLAGATYQAALKYAQRTMSLEEVYIPKTNSDSVVIHNFYIMADQTR